MGRYTNPDQVKIVLAYAECAEVYGFPRAVRRGTCAGHNPRLPIATPWGLVDRDRLPDPVQIVAGVTDCFDLLAGIRQAALDDPWGYGLAMGLVDHFPNRLRL
jgi:hypothetical protein